MPMETDLLMLAAELVRDESRAVLQDLETLAALEIAQLREVRLWAARDANGSGWADVCDAVGRR